MTEKGRIGFRPPGEVIAGYPVGSTSKEKPQLTVILPRDVFDRVSELVHRRNPHHVATNAVSGEAHPLYPQHRVRGVR